MASAASGAASTTNNASSSSSSTANSLLSFSFPLQGPLRKSISVDSFVQSPPRDADTPSGQHITTRNPPSEHNRFSFGPTSAMDERDDSVDSDIERSDPVERYSRSSLKDSSRPHIRGGELPLPSRTPLSTHTMSRMTSTSANSTKTLDDYSRDQPVSFLPPLATLPVSTTQSRTRSGSLGTYMDAGRHRSYTRTSYTIVMVGMAGCGKSTAIQCGLKDHGPISVPLIQRTSLKYSRQDWQIRSKESTLHIIEIDVPVEYLASVHHADSPDWLDDIPDISGVVICYDANDKRSFDPVEGLLRRVHDAARVPYIVLACKSDLQHQVDPREATVLLKKYDAGLVVGAKSHEEGQRGLRRVFMWILNAAERDKRRKGLAFQNSASPSVLRTSPSRAATPTASSFRMHDQDNNTSPTTPSSSNPIFPTSPTRARSTGDLLHAPEALTVIVDSKIMSGKSAHAPQLPEASKDEIDAPTRKESKGKESRPGQYATLNDLLDKLLFLAVSGDDSSYITHFLLTYRRFSGPRNVILAMQKRIRELDEQSAGDPMFACFAQMRICHLLEIWIRDYPYDFAVPGTASALSALITSIISKTYLLHYGSEFLPFLEMLPTLVDHDVTWALKVDVVDESEDTDSFMEEEGPHRSDDSVPSSPTHDQHVSLPSTVAPRERRPSFPLPTMLANGTKPSAGPSEADTSEKQQIKDLLKLSQEIQALEPEDIAQEITRIEVRLFLDIKPRHWLSYTFVSKKDGGEPISAFNALSNHLADWVVSLILCHKTPRARVKQIEKLVEIAQRLRALNNYSALRAFVAGINNATFAGDETMEQFKAKCPEQAKNLQSWDVLLQHIRSHRAYRLALRNSKGACIPALEVHMSDLIRAHEGNGDFHTSEPNKIHWGKFNMMGKFISSTAQCQAQCRAAADYNFPERPHIRELLLSHSVMNDQMQKSRIAPIDLEVDEYRPIPGNGPPRDTALLRKLIFW